MKCVLLGAFAATLVGCSDPYAGPDRQGARVHTTAAKPPPTPRLAPPRHARTPAARSLRSASARVVARSFATTSINWTQARLGAQQRRLASLSAGSLAAGHRAVAASIEGGKAGRTDAGIEAAGDVVAVDLRHEGARFGGVCLTAEQQAAPGRGGAGEVHHTLYDIALVRTARGWKVSRWQARS